MMLCWGKFGESEDPEAMGWGAKAEKDIAKGDVVVSVPREAFMTADTAAANEFCGEVVSRGLNEWQVCVA